MTRRVMWLLNHGTARAFELPMLASLGFTEVFTPKRVPAEAGFRSASVDYATDATLTIPAQDLAVLNAADWYTDPGAEAWSVANRHFDIAFFIVHDLRMLDSVATHFRGAAVWRAYGLERTIDFTRIADLATQGREHPSRMGRRFWFGQAYAHLHEREGAWLQSRQVFLPLGMPAPQRQAPADGGEPWTGDDPRVLFVCPDIAFNHYYRDIHAEFIRSFGDLPHVVGGAQALRSNDPRVLGFVPREQHERNMRDLRVMYYHSTEPYHLHYHPLEAIRSGMPVVFMAGGMLDRLGAVDQPGRCETVQQARDKLQRLLAGDRELTDAIRARQRSMLDGWSAQACRPAWEAGMRQICAELDRFGSRQTRASTLAPRRRPRVAVIVPVAYRGGSLLAACLVAQAVRMGSEQAGTPVDVVLAYPREGMADAHAWFDKHGLPGGGISLRLYRWVGLDAQACAMAMRFAGRGWQDHAHTCWVPDDDTGQFTDCDLWLFVSDRVPGPVLPLRRHACIVYDYTQRYVVDGSVRDDEACLALARSAESVLVTSAFTHDDALQYGGVAPRRVVRVPVLARAPAAPDADRAGRGLHRRAHPGRGLAFVWPVNIGVHKNHDRAAQALALYYGELGGTLACRICGVGSDALAAGGPDGASMPHLRRISQWLDTAARQGLPVRLLGELPEQDYLAELAAARFVWNPSLVDNGTYCMVEAACLGVPALSADYPAARELAAAFSLSAQWFDPRDPMAMARALRHMEDHAVAAAAHPDPALFGAGAHALAYWRAVEACL